MNEWEQTEEDLTTFTHELFLSHRYSNWRKHLSTLDLGVWYLLYDSLKDNDMPLDEIRMFGDNPHSINQEYILKKSRQVLRLHTEYHNY